MSDERIRLDKYLWAIRIFKTRTQAGDAINQGKVKFNGNPVKSSKHVSPGDKYEIKTEAKKWLIEVTALLQKRVAHSEAIKHYIDHTPEEPVAKPQNPAFVDYTGKRHSKQGRPTKRNRREMDEYLL